MKYTIRPHTLQERDEIVEVVKYALKESRANGYTSNFFHVDIHEKKLYQWIKDSETNPHMYLRIVLDEGGKIVGGIAGFITPYVFSYEFLAQEQITYLAPTVKDPRVVIRLIKGFVDWADENEAVEVMISTSTGYKTAKFMKLAERMGFKLAAVGLKRRLR